MKTPNLREIIPITLAAVVIAFILQALFFESGRGGETSHAYGNLWVRYAWHDRGMRSAKVDWIIATPEFPAEQEYDEIHGLWTYRFKTGKEFKFAADDDHLIWVDPVSGPQVVPAGLTKAMIDRIRMTSYHAKGQQFDSPRSFLTSIETRDAEQVSSPNDR